MTVEYGSPPSSEREQVRERIEEVVNVTWVAEKLLIHQESVRRLMRRGDLPAEYLGNQLVTYRGVVEIFAEGYPRKRGAPSPEERERFERAIETAYDLFSQIKEGQESDSFDVLNAAELLGIHPGTLRRLIREGKLATSSAEFGNKLFIKMEDLMRFKETYYPRRGRRPKNRLLT